MHIVQNNAFAAQPTFIAVFAKRNCAPSAATSRSISSGMSSRGFSPSTRETIRCFRPLC